MRGRLSVLVVAFVLAFGVVVLGGPTLGTAYADNCHFNEDGEWVCEGGNDPPPGDPGDPGDPGPGPKQPYDIYYTPACMVNGPPPGDPNVMCQNATMACQVRGEEGSLMMRIYYQWEQNGPWELQDTRCVGADEQEPDPVITPEMIVNWLTAGQLPKAQVFVNPGNGRTLINFPTIFYADGETSYDVNPTILGVPVTIHAEATSFEWNWGDGASDTTPTGGVKYEPGRSMDSYITHKYLKLDRYTISLRVTWTITFQAGTQPEQTTQLTLEGTNPPEVEVLEKEQFLGER